MTPDREIRVLQAHRDIEWLSSQLQKAEREVVAARIDLAKAYGAMAKLREALAAWDSE
jgi:hypothetical protein